MTDNNVLSGRVVFVVDDDQLFRAYVTALLSQANIKVVGLVDSEELSAQMNKIVPDCILLDYMLASENGLQIHDQLRQRFHDLPPVLMLSADESQRTAIRAFRFGLNDFIPKRNLQLNDLLNSIQTAVAQHEAENGKRLAESKNREQAQFDEFTGLYSRHELDRKLALVSDVARRRHQSCAVILICFTNYRALSAQFGIAAADQMLRIFAQRLTSVTKPEETWARYDTDIFCSIVDRDPSQSAIDRRCAELTEALTFEQNIGAIRVNLSASAVTGVRVGGEEQLSSVAARLASDFEEQKNILAASSGPSEWSRLHHAPQQSTNQSGEATLERRRSERRRILKTGFVVLHGGTSKLRCAVRNISDHGAGIRLQTQLALPEEFSLQFAAKQARSDACVNVGTSTTTPAWNSWTEAPQYAMERLKTKRPKILACEDDDSTSAEIDSIPMRGN